MVIMVDPLHSHRTRRRSRFKKRIQWLHVASVEHISLGRLRRDPESAGRARLELSLHSDSIFLPEWLMRWECRHACCHAARLPHPGDGFGGMTRHQCAHLCLTDPEAFAQKLLLHADSIASPHGEKATEQHCRLTLGDGADNAATSMAFSTWDDTGQGYSQRSTPWSHSSC